MIGEAITTRRDRRGLGVTHCAAPTRRRGSSPGRAFWRYSLALYGRREVARSCLRLQQRVGADVNVLLLCCWLAARGGGALNARALGRALARVAAWREDAILPLRRARRALKVLPTDAPEGLARGLRKRIAAAEIDAEQVEQIMLAGLVGVAPPSQAPPDAVALRHAAASLTRYLGALGIAQRDAETEDIAVLLGAAFPDTSGDDLARALRRFDTKPARRRSARGQM